MTFYEAAVEVLRRSGRPLHFKKITEVAMRDELLSHVGKTPESTMEDRLDQETKKDDTSWIVRTRPGVYMLRTEVAERLNEEAKARDEENRKKREEARAKKAEEALPEEEESEAEDEESDIEAEDEDDEDEDEDEDEESEEEESEEEEASEDDDERGEGRGRRRRRRRGRRRSSDKDEPKKEERSATAEAKPNGRAPKAAQPAPAEREEPTEKRGRRRGRKDTKDTKDTKSTKSKQGSFEGLAGERYESIAEAAFAVIQANGRKPINAAKVAEVVFDKKLVKFHTHDPEATVESAMVTDNQVRSRSGRRPLFAQYRDARWGLTEWGVSDEGIEKERQILALAAELRQEALEQLGEAMALLKPEAFEMVVMTLLERLDYRNLKVSKRTSDGDTYFSADWRRGFSDLRVCVHVASDAETTLDSDAVKELRETLEHYSATEGIIVHIGEISKDAVRESRLDDAAKVTIIDRKAFVRLLVDEGIGVRTFQTPLVMVDTAFIDALQR